MSIISALRTFIATWEGLEDGKIIYVDHLDDEPVSYTIIPLPGAKILDQDILGNSYREYPFAFRTAESTADNLERIATNEFFEDFSDWIDLQNKNGTFPSLESDKTALEIYANNWGYLFEQSDSDTGIYQINCTLRYRQGV